MTTLAAEWRTEAACTPETADWFWVDGNLTADNRQCEKRRPMSDIIGLHGGGILEVHSPDRCSGTPCPIHNPSEHALRLAPLHWRDDRRIMERICPHGVGHPDPDDLRVQSGNGVHGCDGCCARRVDGNG